MKSSIINHRSSMMWLLAAVGSKHALDQTPPETAPYDWRDPHYFNPEQQNRLVPVLSQVANRWGEILGRARGSACEVSLRALTQHFAGDLCRDLELDQDYCLTFGPEKEPACGFLALPPQAAQTWVTWLLGDSESARDPNQALSALEESLLADLATRLLEASLSPLRPTHKLKPAGALGKGQPTVAFELTEEVGKIVFQVKTADAGEPMEITLVLPCSRLAALAGKPAPAAGGANHHAPLSPQELSRTLMEHVQELTVTVRATLATAMLTFQDILDLAPGDILLLDKPVEGLTELILDGRVLFRGRPARSQGRYAVVITETQAPDNPPAAAPKAPKPANERI